MKLLVSLASVTLLMVGMAFGADGESPEDVVQGFIDAILAGDGAKAADYMSSNAFAEYELSAAFKQDPEMSLPVLASMGIETTADEIADWTGKDLFVALMGTDSVRAKIEELNVHIIGSEIDGEEASVTLTSDDGDESEFYMILENGAWKIDVMSN